MANIHKTSQVARDLIEIWNYTADKWGEKQADQYLRKLDLAFEKVNRGEAVMKKLAENIQFIKCEHHYIFLVAEKKPIVIAVLHEKMDMLARLKQRLA